ncbi:hypothetical protein GYH30_033879 [Glycine max]|nr:hypothetical protein GYH30_033879 [Glycine max]
MQMVSVTLRLGQHWKRLGITRLQRRHLSLKNVI